MCLEGNVGTTRFYDNGDKTDDGRATKRHEAAQQALEKQIEMLKVVINTQVPNNTSLQSPNVHPSPILSEKASTNIQTKLEEGEKQICGDEDCEDVVEQTESEFMKVMLIFIYFDILALNIYTQNY